MQAIDVGPFQGQVTPVAIKLDRLQTLVKVRGLNGVSPQH